MPLLDIAKYMLKNVQIPGAEYFLFFLYSFFNLTSMYIRIYIPSQISYIKWGYFDTSQCFAVLWRLIISAVIPKYVDLVKYRCKIDFWTNSSFKK